MKKSDIKPGMTVYHKGRPVVVQLKTPLSGGWVWVKREKSEYWVHCNQLSIKP